MCRGIVGLNLQPSSRGPRGVTEMGYPMYPPSLYRAISYGSKLGVPMYITENGTPLTEDTSERSEWIDGYLGQVCLMHFAFVPEKQPVPFFLLQYGESHISCVVNWLALLLCWLAMTGMP